MDCSPPDSSVHLILQQEYTRGLPFPSPGYLPDPGIKPRSPILQAEVLILSHQAETDPQREGLAGAVRGADSNAAALWAQHLLQRSLAGQSRDTAGFLHVGQSGPVGFGVF